ncbi:hypothetical protein [Sinimarinibacterium sp. CAU 1509]|uniref:hypothetical protein n=1 Tax=Sinimarinibacterium sp. CAU 1509 TaxID=2562283 RepID=UPI0010ABF149|nr:hypothetical protein [Sinimarinibacterium sp. CAU 1509]
MADYQRPLEKEAVKRCVRVELGPKNRTPESAAPIRMELRTADAAAIMSVLLGYEPSVHLHLVRPGVHKTLTLMRGSESPASCVLRMSAKNSTVSPKVHTLQCGIDADDALMSAGIVAASLEAVNPGLDPGVWHSQVLRIGRIVARASAQQEGRHAAAQ